MVYRRHLADDAELEHSEADEMARRWPVAWLILRPAKYGPRHQLPTQVMTHPAVMRPLAGVSMRCIRAPAWRLRVMLPCVRSAVVHPGF